MKPPLQTFSMKGKKCLNCSIQHIAQILRYSRDYYLKNDSKNVEIVTAFRDMIVTVTKLLVKDKENGTQVIKASFFN